jgi:opacity protein-like surface antigen
MKILLSLAAMAAMTAAAQAADLPVTAPPVPWTWNGIYLGAHIGAGRGRSDFNDGSGPVIYGNDVHTPAALGGGQIGANWQAPGSAVVFGAEAELSAIGADGTNTCFASSGYYSSSNCRVRQMALGTATGRIGLATGVDGRTLVFGKAGGAWLNEKLDIASFRDATTMRSDRFGWIVGAGIEHAIAPAWSLKLEYDYADFGAVHMATPASASLIPAVPFPIGVPTAGGGAAVSQTMQTVKLGLNLKLDGDAGARWGDQSATPLGLPATAMPALLPPGTEAEIGGRVWYSAGRFQKDLGSARNPALQDVLVSRLTYDSDAISGEVFGRVDTASNVVIKGFVGGGNLARGKMNDEDWIIDSGDTPYSNTLSDPVTGSIGYLTADIGYDMIRGRAGKFAAFIGYNYLRDDKTAKGCIQLAHPDGACAGGLPGTVSVISENDQWHSLRIGINGVVALTDRLQLTADAAYLPYVNFHGVDNHMLRSDEQTTLSQESGTGQGVQLEAVLSYRITSQLSVGAGGRYWAMWATKPDALTDAFGIGCPCQALPVRTERFGGFLQASYAFDSFR